MTVFEYLNSRDGILIALGFKSFACDFDMHDGLNASVNAEVMQSTTEIYLIEVKNIVVYKISYLCVFGL